MKLALFSLLVCIVVSQTPHPVPVPLSLSTLNGLWYVTNSFDFYQTRNFSSEVTCWTLKFVVEEKESGGELFHTFILNNKTLEGQSHFETKNSNSSWRIDGTVWDWVALDPLSQSWGTFASGYSQKALLLSRTPNISNLVVNAQVALLKGEGYDVNSSNFMNIVQSACPESFEISI